MSEAAMNRDVPVWRTWGIDLTYFQMTALLVGVLAVARAAVLLIADYNLGPDEAQYWYWSLEPAFGYFSKPPMIAWVIGLSTGIFGHSEWAIRLPSPLIHAGTSLLLFALGARLFSPRIGFWAALAFATLPAVWFSSGLVSTDVPLLFFWTLALFALRRLNDTHAWPDALLLGAAIGLGFLSKYAMIYFIVGLALWLVVSTRARWLLTSPKGYAALGLAAALFAPNVLWNLANDFSTVSHTASNANWGADLFNPGELIGFIGDQFGIFGPLMFAAFLWGFVRLRTWAVRGEVDERHLFLLCFTVPALAVVAIQAFISRANANWAAVAYSAGTLLVVAWLLAPRTPRWLLPSSVTLHLVGGIGLYLLLLSPGLIEALGRTNDFKRVRGWDTIAMEIQSRLDAEPGRYTAVLTDNRLVHTELLYYLRPTPVPIRTWDWDGVPGNHFELVHPYNEEFGAPVLYVSRNRPPTGVFAAFDRAEPIAQLDIPIGGERRRTFWLHSLDGYRGR
jgi:4-amino-4-deoxy-L-arabinose transferase-like glycosyltransferase